MLEDTELRDGIGQFSNWPTIPQLYVKGELIGGFGIVTEIDQLSELTTEPTEKGMPVEATG